MHEVKKIFVFLITFALTISGLHICQEISPVFYGLPTSQPIATDWEMLNETSSVIGITAALPTPTQNIKLLSSQQQEEEVGSSMVDAIRSATDWAIWRPCGCIRYGS